MTRHNFELLNHGQTLMPEDVCNTRLEPMASLQAKLSGKQRRKVLLMGKVLAIPEELAPHGRTWTLQGVANIRHTDVLASVTQRR
jgi:hypothetical protein